MATGSILGGLETPRRHLTGHGIAPIHHMLIPTPTIKDPFRTEEHQTERFGPYYTPGPNNTVTATCPACTHDPGWRALTTLA